MKPITDIFVTEDEVTEKPVVYYTGSPTKYKRVPELTLPLKLITPAPHQFIVISRPVITVIKLTS